MADKKNQGLSDDAFVQLYLKEQQERSKPLDPRLKYGGRDAPPTKQGLEAIAEDTFLAVPRLIEGLYRAGKSGVERGGKRDYIADLRREQEKALRAGDKDRVWAIESEIAQMDPRTYSPELELGDLDPTKPGGIGNLGKLPQFAVENFLFSGFSEPNNALYGITGGITGGAAGAAQGARAGLSAPAPPQAKGLAALGLGAIDAARGAVLGATAGSMGSEAAFGERKYGTMVQRQAEAGKLPLRADGSVGFDYNLAGAAGLGSVGLDNVLESLIGGKVGEALVGGIGEQGVKSVLGSATKEAVKTAPVEGATEAMQAVLERGQAGLSIADGDAGQEYLDNFLAGAVLGGTAGGATGAVEAVVGNQKARKDAERQAQIDAIKEALGGADPTTPEGTADPDPTETEAATPEGEETPTEPEKKTPDPRLTDEYLAQFGAARPEGEIPESDTIEDDVRDAKEGRIVPVFKANDGDVEIATSKALDAEAKSREQDTFEFLDNLLGPGWEENAEQSTQPENVLQRALALQQASPDAGLEDLIANMRDIIAKRGRVLPTPLHEDQEPGVALELTNADGSKRYVAAPDPVSEDGMVRADLARKNVGKPKEQPKAEAKAPDTAKVDQQLETNQRRIDKLTQKIAGLEEGTPEYESARKNLDEQVRIRGKLLGEKEGLTKQQGAGLPAPAPQPKQKKAPKPKAAPAPEVAARQEAEKDLNRGAVYENEEGDFVRRYGSWSPETGPAVTDQDPGPDDAGERLAGGGFEMAPDADNPNATNFRIRTDASPEAIKRAKTAIAAQRKEKVKDKDGKDVVANEPTLTLFGPDGQKKTFTGYAGITALGKVAEGKNPFEETKRGRKPKPKADKPQPIKEDKADSPEAIATPETDTDTEADFEPEAQPEPEPEAKPEPKPEPKPKLEAKKGPTDVAKAREENALRRHYKSIAAKIDPKEDPVGFRDELRGRLERVFMDEKPKDPAKAREWRDTLEKQTDRAIQLAAEDAAKAEAEAKPEAKPDSTPQFMRGESQAELATQLIRQWINGYSKRRPDGPQPTSGVERYSWESQNNEALEYLSLALQDAERQSRGKNADDPGVQEAIREARELAKENGLYIGPGRGETDKFDAVAYDDETQSLYQDDIGEVKIPAVYKDGNVFKRGLITVPQFRVAPKDGGGTEITDISPIAEMLRDRFKGTPLEAVAIKFVDKLVMSVNKDGTENRARGVTNGGIIKLALSFKPGTTIGQVIEALSQTINHEIVHAARNMGFYSDAEFQRLFSALRRTKVTAREAELLAPILGDSWRNAAGKTWAKAFLDSPTFKGAYGGLSENLKLEEMLAEFVRVHAALKDRASEAAPGIINKFVRDIAKFFRDLGKIVGVLSESDREALSKFADEITTGAKGRTANRRDMRFADPQFMFAGRYAATADEDAFKRAEEMEGEGQRAWDIWRETGWFRGRDGKWRFEIPDTDAALIDYALDERDDPMGGRELHFSGRLTDILVHDELFTAEPALENIRVKIEISPTKKYAGNYHIGQGRITLSARTKEEALDILLHEVMHAMQELSGFENGYNKAQALGDAERALAKVEAALLDNNKMGWWSRLEEIRNDLLETVDLLKTPGIGTNIAYRIYLRMRGEAEARNVQERARMARDGDNLKAMFPLSTEDESDYNILTNTTAFTALIPEREFVLSTINEVYRKNKATPDRLSPKALFSQIATRGVDAMILSTEETIELTENTLSEGRAWIEQMKAEASGREPDLLLEDSLRNKREIMDEYEAGLIENRTTLKILKRLADESIDQLIPVIRNVDSWEAIFGLRPFDTISFSQSTMEADSGQKTQRHRNGDTIPSRLGEESKGNEAGTKPVPGSLSVQTQTRQARLRDGGDIATGRINVSTSERRGRRARILPVVQALDVVATSIPGERGGMTVGPDGQFSEDPKAKRVVYNFKPSEGMHSSWVKALENTGLEVIFSDDPARAKTASIYYIGVADTLRSAGVGEEIYRRVVDDLHARGFEVTSDLSVSTSATDLYGKLASEGYQIGGLRWNGEQWVPDGAYSLFGKQIMRDGMAPVFRVGPRLQFMFAGENAATADRTALDWAKAQVEAGENPELIRQVSGWFKRRDGKWRFEIDDSRAKLNISALNNGRARLGQVLTHPQLFQAYPWLNNLLVDFKKMKPGVLAKAWTDVGEIGVSRALSEEKLLLALLHEIQHFIQAYEQFAGGAPANNSDYFSSAGEAEARTVSARAKFSAEERKNKSPLSAKGGADIDDSRTKVTFTKVRPDVVKSFADWAYEQWRIQYKYKDPRSFIDKLRKKPRADTPKLEGLADDVNRYDRYHELALAGKFPWAVGVDDVGPMFMADGERAPLDANSPIVQDVAARLYAGLDRVNPNAAAASLDYHIARIIGRDLSPSVMEAISYIFKDFDLKSDLHPSVFHAMVKQAYRETQAAKNNFDADLEAKKQANRDKAEEVAAKARARKAMKPVPNMYGLSSGARWGLSRSNMQKGNWARWRKELQRYGEATKNELDLMERYLWNEGASRPEDPDFRIGLINDRVITRQKVEEAANFTGMAFSLSPDRHAWRGLTLRGPGDVGAAPNGRSGYNFVSIIGAPGTPFHGYGGSHGASGTMGHFRYTSIDIDGKKYAIIEEIQSDFFDLKDDDFSPEEMSNGPAAAIAGRMAHENLAKKAPLRKDWPQFIMRHAIAHLINAGYDGILLNTGEGVRSIPGMETYAGKMYDELLPAYAKKLIGPQNGTHTIGRKDMVNGRVTFGSVLMEAYSEVFGIGNVPAELWEIHKAAISFAEGSPETYKWPDVFSSVRELARDITTVLTDQRYAATKALKEALLAAGIDKLDATDIVAKVGGAFDKAQENARQGRPITLPRFDFTPELIDRVQNIGIPMYMADTSSKGSPLKLGDRQIGASRKHAGAGLIPDIMGFNDLVEYANDQIQQNPEFEKFTWFAPLGRVDQFVHKQLKNFSKFVESKVDPRYRHVLKWLNPHHYFDPFSGLGEAKDLYRIMRMVTQGAEVRAQNTLLKFTQELDKLDTAKMDDILVGAKNIRGEPMSPDEKREAIRNFITDYLETGRDLDEASGKTYEQIAFERIPEGKWREIASQMKDTIEEVGKMAVNAGLITQEQYDGHFRRYLFRGYLEHLETYEPGSGIRLSGLFYARERKPVPEEQRAILGEIKDLKFRLSMSMLPAMLDTARASFLGSIMVASARQAPGEQFVLPASFAFMGGKPVSLFSLAEDLPKLEARLYAEEDRLRNILGAERVQKMKKDGVQLSVAHGALAGRIARIKAEIAKNPAYAAPHIQGKLPSGYVRVPTNKARYGELAGAIVKRGILEDINGSGMLVTSVESPLLQNADWLSRKLTSYFKFAKVVLNPVSHARQWFSNTITLLAEGRSPTLVAESIASILAYHAEQNPSWAWMQRFRMLGGAENMRIAMEHGQTQSSFTEAELRRFAQIHDSLSLLKAQEAVRSQPFIGMNLMRALRMAQTAARILGKVADVASSAYQFSDTVFKVAIIIDERRRGKPPAMAAMKARESYHDYSEAPSWLRFIRERGGLFMAPFISFFYYSTGWMARNLWVKSVSMGLTMASLYYTLPMLANMLWQPEDDEWGRPWWDFGRVLGLMPTRTIEEMMASKSTKNFTEPKELLTDQVAKRATVTQSPIRFDKDRPTYWDQGPSTPFGGQVALGDALFGGDRSLRERFTGIMGAIGMTGDPITQIAYVMGTGQTVNGWTIFSDRDSERVKNEKFMRYAIETVALPGFITQFAPPGYNPINPDYTQTGSPIWEALAGPGINARGEPTLSKGAGLARAAGFLTYEAANVDTARNRRIEYMQRRVSEAKYAYTQALNNRRIRDKDGKLIEGASEIRIAGLRKDWEEARDNLIRYQQDTMKFIEMERRAQERRKAANE